MPISSASLHIQYYIVCIILEDWRQIEICEEGKIQRRVSCKYYRVQDLVSRCYTHLPLTNPPSVIANSLNFHKLICGWDNNIRISSALFIIGAAPIDDEGDDGDDPLAEGGELVAEGEVGGDIGRGEQEGDADAIEQNDMFVGGWCKEMRL